MTSVLILKSRTGDLAIKNTYGQVRFPASMLGSLQLLKTPVSGNWRALTSLGKYTHVHICAGTHTQTHTLNNNTL